MRHDYYLQSIKNTDRFSPSTMRFPQVLKGKTLPNGKSCFEGRPGAEMPDYDFAKEVRWMD